MNAPPPGYNANESMLEGGTATITSVMGGGANPVKKALKHIRSKLSKKKKGRSRAQASTRKHSTPVKQDGGVGGHYTLLSNDAFANMRDIETINSSEIDVSTLVDITDLPDPPDAATVAKNYAEYKNGADLLWKRSGGSSAVKALMSTVGVTAMNPNNLTGQRGTDRLCIILPQETYKIVVFPPIMGDIELFKKCIKIARPTSTSSPNPMKMCYIFTTPFFKGGETDDSATVNANKIANEHLFAYFVHVKLLLKDNNADLYILTEQSPRNINVSKELTSKITISDSTTPIYPLLEPTYIVYPYASNIQPVDGNSDPIDGAEADKTGGILFSAASPGEPVLPAADSSMEGLISVILKDPFIFPINTPKVATTGMSGMSGMSGTPATPATSVGTDITTLASLAYKPNITKPDPQLDRMNFRQITLTNIGETVYYKYIKNYSKPPPSAKSTISSYESIFLSSPDAYIDDVPLVPVELGTKEFSIRMSLPEVKENWRNAIFTDEESNFLNSLNINPKRLNAIYAEKWKDVLAKNLTVISRSKCFKDNHLILHAECQETQTFIAKIFESFVENSDDIVELERGQMQSAVAAATAEILKNKDDADAIAKSGDIFDATNFNKAFFPDPSTNYSYTLVKERNAQITMIVDPGLVQNQYSIDTLVVDLKTKQHQKARFTLTMLKGGVPTEQEIGDARKEVIAQYRRIKAETEKPIISGPPFPGYQIILPD